MTVASILSGAIFGNQSSPVSDITIMSATAANLPHLEHVVSQLYYTSLALVVAFIGSLIVAIYPHPYIILPVLIIVEIGLYLLIAKYNDDIKAFFQGLKSGRKRIPLKAITLNSK